MAPQAVAFRCRVDVVTVATGEIIHVGGVRVGRVVSSLGGDVFVAAVAFETACDVRLLGRRIFGVASPACESGGHMFVDQKSVSSARSRR